MHPIDAHQAAAKAANDAFRKTYGRDDFEFNTPEHAFWLREFDKAFAKASIR